VNPTALFKLLIPPAGRRWAGADKEKPPWGSRWFGLVDVWDDSGEVVDAGEEELTKLFVGFGEIRNHDDFAAGCGSRTNSVGGVFYGDGVFRGYSKDLAGMEVWIRMRLAVRYVVGTDDIIEEVKEADACKTLTGRAQLAGGYNSGRNAKGAKLLKHFECAGLHRNVVFV
jgi:hypothetical protein